MCQWERRSQPDKIILLVSRSREEESSVIVLTLSPCLWFSLINRKQASRYTARGFLIRQNNSIDLKIDDSKLLCDQSISFTLPSLFVLAFSLSIPPSSPLLTFP